MNAYTQCIEIITVECGVLEMNDLRYLTHDDFDYIVSSNGGEVKAGAVHLLRQLLGIKAHVEGVQHQGHQVRCARGCAVW